MLTAIGLFGTGGSAVQAADANPYPFKQGFPTATASQHARADETLQRAIVAYRFWYPTVSLEGIFNGNRAVGIEDGKQWGIAAAGPRQVGFTLNSDTPYGSGVLDLTDGPVVIDLPPGPFIGLINDHNQGWVADMGLPGPEAGKGGKHLILPPGYQGKVPAKSEGYYVSQSPSLKNLLALRSMPVGGDVAKAMAAFQNVKIQRWSEQGATGPALQAVDTTKLPLDSSSLKWEDNFQFWQKLDKVIQEEPLQPAYLPMYGLLAELGIQKGQTFAPDEKLKAVLTKAARLGRDQMLVSAFDSDRPGIRNWPDRHWEWVGLVPGSAQFETPAGVDLDARDRWFAQAIVTSPAMFRRDAGAGSLYWLSARDGQGNFLDGGKQYTLTVPQPVPGKLFWSVTLYDAQTRSQVQTDQDKAALRSLFELKDIDTTKPVVLSFGPNPPKGGDTTHWIKTVPGRGWFAYFRIYGPEAAAFDKTWKPGDIVRQ
ncbi:DUF1254 domain-containing protein [Pandoraea pnomenusa]|uniref:DUF1254 domain-containing protein n=1 Tax=Pandoraea pnomenusa TaxID=93220 RepID=UPI00333F1D09